ncbi:MAG: hypothetical protein BWY95_02042 [Bacteroidetes bacterium ADurb.BinA104]|nr:MAG: hypothetical protein BWY95_02042 [Bacteroidetes bacterium ADurb.BinA104]
MDRKLFVECHTNTGTSFLVGSHMVKSCPSVLELSQEELEGMKEHPFVEVIKVYEPKESHVEKHEKSEGEHEQKHVKKHKG